MKVRKIILFFSLFIFVSKTQIAVAKNVILLIGDGMGLSQISYEIINNPKSNFLYFKNIGFIKTSSDVIITDSAAAATAFATGKKTYNGAISVDKNHKPLKTIIEFAKENNFATGLIATSEITHATPAAFVAHQESREMGEEIATNFLNGNVDVFIGGGLNHFQNRKDGKNLVQELKNKGYKIYLNKNDLFSDKYKGKIAALLAERHMPTIKEGRGNYEKQALNKALNILSKNKNGFFLMVEGSQIDFAGHKNDAEYIKNEIHDFDEVIGAALEFAEKNRDTLIIVTADHETGGFALTETKDSLLKDKYSKIDPAFTSNGHSAAMVPVFAYGPKSENFQGIYENTEIFNKIKDFLEI